MDMNSVAFHSSTDNDAAERMKFESFKLGNASNSHNGKTNHHHARSRSRNLSISSIPSIHSTNSLNSATDLSPVSPTFPSTSAAPTAPSTKRNSHHRRRSSVSTRHESADMMGVAVTDLPCSLSDDNINLGDRDSVRRRALWALEGKPDNNNSFKVEIPDISTPEINKKFEIPNKASFLPSTIGSGYGGGINNAASKRDSFGKHLTSSASAKELLHTLVEEDEEEYDKEDERNGSMLIYSPIDMSPDEPTAMAVGFTVSTPTPLFRPRPASLNLRPLSLNKENIIGLGNLLTPSTPTPRSGLRSLTLAPSPSLSLATNQSTNTTVTSATINNNRRQSLTLHSPTSIAPPGRRPSLNLEFEANFSSPTSVSSSDSGKRRASISYRCSTDIAYGQFALPTPELTPTLEHRHSHSSASSSSVNERPLSETEQHFLYQAHTTLVQRITDLERALASRSQPASCIFDASLPSSAPLTLSYVQPEGPSNELRQLIADLKAERDELSKDVEGWRVRVSDLEKQVGMFARRIELERREAWVARERSGLLEIEKKRLEKAFEAKSVEVQETLDNYIVARTACDEAKEECERLKKELEKKQEIEDECDRMRSTLAKEKKQREELEASLLSAKSAPTIVADRPPAYSRGMRTTLGFLSIDSEATDVEPTDDFQISLKSVAEEYEGFSDEDIDDLSGYEDENEDDNTFQSHHGSSLGSLNEVTEPVSLCIDSPAALPVSSAPTSPARVMDDAHHHARRGSLVKAWTFATGTLALPCKAEPDNFFGCLEDSDDSTTPLENDRRVDIHGDNGRSFFSQSLLEDDDSDLPPFLLPRHIGFEIPEERVVLDSVREEDEVGLGLGGGTPADDFVGEVVEGGIVFKFSPPDDPGVSSEFQTPSSGSIEPNPCISATHEDEDKNTTPFKFPHMTTPLTLPPEPLIVAQTTFAQVDSNTATVRTPIRKPTRTPLPSSIPRSVSLRTYTPTKSTPERCVITRNPSNPFITHPTKREGTIPTFIPQPRARDALSMILPSAKSASPTFIRQPQRGSTVPVATKHLAQSPAPSINARPTTYRSNDCITAMTDSNTLAARQVIPPTSIAESPTATAKLSLQSLTSLMPSAFSWSARLFQKSDAPLLMQDGEAPGLLWFNNVDKKMIEESGEKCYVSKEKQLERLKNRFEAEQKTRRYAGDAAARSAAISP